MEQKIYKSLKIENLLILGFILSILTTYFYTYSYFGYAAISFLLMAIIYFLYIKKFIYIDKYLRSITLYLLLVSSICSIANWDIKSMLMVNMSLLCPVILSVIKIDMTNIKKACVATTIISLLFAFSQVNFQILGKINSNTLSFLIYMGVSISFIWFKIGKNKIFSSLMMVSGFMLCLQAGSRNVAIVLPICVALLLLPKQFFLNKIFYRVIYITVLVYIIFAPEIMEWGFANESIAENLNSYTTEFSEKSWSLDNRLVFYPYIQNKIASMSFLGKIFGTGIQYFHGHNLFYQSIGTYGYVGTILIWLIYIRAFEMARTLIVEENDMLSLGCVVVLIGHFLIQGADVYMIGCEGISVMPHIITGLIFNQYRVYMKEKRLV